MAFTAKDVAKLREMTGVGMMDCKKALTACDGDMEKASEYLREQGINVAAKKASRIASEGMVASYVAKNGFNGALFELNCESDFVAKSESFIELATELAKQVTQTNPSDIDTMLNAPSISDSKYSVVDTINNATAKIGEKISARRFARFESKCGRVESYLHMGGNIGVMVQFDTAKDFNANEEFTAMCHDVAMQIAASSPQYVSENEVPADEVEREKAILTAQSLNEGKPAAVVEKMVVGRIKKFFKEICLVDQEFVKDPAIDVRTLVANMAKKLGGDIKIVRFERFTMGEGLEKKVDNLAEEVAKLQNKN